MENNNNNNTQMAAVGGWGKTARAPKSVSKAEGLAGDASRVAAAVVPPVFTSGELSTIANMSNAIKAVTEAGAPSTAKAGSNQAVTNLGGMGGKSGGDPGVAPLAADASPEEMASAVVAALEASQGSGGEGSPGGGVGGSDPLHAGDGDGGNNGRGPGAGGEGEATAAPPVAEEEEDVLDAAVATASAREAWSARLKVDVADLDEEFAASSAAQILATHTPASGEARPYAKRV